MSGSSEAARAQSAGALSWHKLRHSPGRTRQVALTRSHSQSQPRRRSRSPQSPHKLDTAPGHRLSVAAAIRESESGSYESREPDLGLLTTQYSLPRVTQFDSVTQFNPVHPGLLSLTRVPGFIRHMEQGRGLRRWRLMRICLYRHRQSIDTS